jgi:hypothetical protein
MGCPVEKLFGDCFLIRFFKKYYFGENWHAKESFEEWHSLGVDPGATRREIVHGPQLLPPALKTLGLGKKTFHNSQPCHQRIGLE